MAPFPKQEQKSIFTNKRITNHTTKKLGYCGRPKLLQKPKKPPLKAHLAYCGGSTRLLCIAAIVQLWQ